MNNRHSKDSKSIPEWVRLLPVLLALSGATLAVYWPARHFEFINYDDPNYVTGNSHVRSGVTEAGLAWAFTTGAASNWHPLTWISHMVDCQFHGVNPGGHHLTNILFHVANALLLFTVFRQMTGAVWRSAMLAALFALHPLHVESVAWVSERKDVISTFFWLLSTWAYLEYAKGARPRLFYVLALGFFVMGLMCKPMLVTLPFTLLLLDYWPLKRFSALGFPPRQRQSTAGRSADLNVSIVGRVRGVLSSRLFLEKLPFFVFAAASCVVTFEVQQHGGAMMSLSGLSFRQRVANALVSYFRYVGKLLWPAKLSVLYPHPYDWPLWLQVTAILFLSGVTAWVCRFARRQPYLPVGWFWFLGTLVPVIGVVQVGLQSMADRYTYVPGIGLLFLLVWGAADAAGRLAIPNAAMGSLAGGLLVACAIGSERQLVFWRDSGTLFRHTLEVTGDNALASYQLGTFLMERGQLPEAAQCFRDALRLEPNFVMAYDSLGLALVSQGRLEEAMECYQTALRFKPGDADALEGVGMALASRGETGAAITFYRKALEANPRFVEALDGLGGALAAEGRLDEAVEQFRLAVRIDPESYISFHNLGLALANSGRLAEAVEAYTNALKLRPRSDQTRFGLANALAQQGHLEEAVAQYKESLSLNASNFEVQFNLAYTLAQLGRRDEAVAHVTEALRLNPDYAEAKQLLGKLREGRSQ